MPFLLWYFIGFNQFFKMKPCEVDDFRVHELMTTLPEDGTHQDREAKKEVEVLPKSMQVLA